MKKIYLDNASTTAVRIEVIEEIAKVLSQNYGNPSSTHSFGRSAKSILELSRKSIAKLIHGSAQEIIFTSSATEANNWILQSVVKNLNIKQIITSKIEHHSVLKTIQSLQKEYTISIAYVSLEQDGEINMAHLEDLVSSSSKTLVSLMHVNNEIGTVLDIEKVAQICKQHSALFHSDMVQSIGKTEIDLTKIAVDFITASAHKFHGPKGIGFAFIRKNIALPSMFYGGEQEKGMRAGTEAVHQVFSMAKALEIAYLKLDLERNHILNLKKYLIEQLKINFKNFKIIGKPTNFYTIINILLPLPKNNTSMIVFELDLKGIAVSRGSACQSGSNIPSHVLQELLNPNDIKNPNIRISFSYDTTIKDIDYLIDSLKSFY